MIKIYISYKVQANATGGGNQFLKALKKYFIKQGCYTEEVEEADVVLFNSHQFISDLFLYKLKYPNKIFVHRIDGPMRLYNTMQDSRDHIVNSINKYIAEGTIFQSNWSQEQNLKMGLEQQTYQSVILNAPDPHIFNTQDKRALNPNKKIKLIATSWSSNMKKGFETYAWLDKNLDFEQYEMTFVGNSPIKFENIESKKPMNSVQLAQELKQHDIFITASQKDPCSNSLIEALHCGLPALYLNDGGHSQIVQNAGESFDTQDEIPEKLNKIVQHYSHYQKSINLPSIDQVAQEYYGFLSTIYTSFQKQKHKTKPFTYFHVVLIKASLFFQRIKRKLHL
jgi:glycosyltransferase involved in cell wall biosynthesis